MGGETDQPTEMSLPFSLIFGIDVDSQEIL